MDQQERQDTVLAGFSEWAELDSADQKTEERKKSVEDEDIIRLVAER